ncbi:MAG: DsbA family protein, partial [Candidatus Binatus sp.]
RGTGFDTMAMTPRKARYLWRDHARYAEWTGLPFRKPSRFPIKTSSALRAVLAVAAETRADDGGAAREHAQRTLSQAFMRAYWERDEDISDRGVLAAVATSAGFDGARLMDAAEGKYAREDLAFLTESAVARGVFGAPTFFVGNEMFWGKDRLDFVERLLKRPE